MSSPKLLESIRLVDGELPLLDYHQRRVDRSRRTYYPKGPAFRLAAVTNELSLPTVGEYKLRLVYGAELLSWEVQPYSIRAVSSLQVVHADDLCYGKKYADRTAINGLYNRRGGCDDILIVQRNHVTDASYANLALFDGSHWYTPAWPLLRGTRREFLIKQKVLRPSVIRLRDIPHFQSIRLVNSMMEWDDGPTIRTEAVLGL
ncbi:4-amino-4-deoxychorismate lyase [Lewinella aquimaris]|uniref:4-amino-4-deoxychorismate lyase n=1 Tax=Neolewinella aquimaris TaxID=1835722 RepID=A0A840DXW3_9BACT|nr:aminotransferase class IV [Neolewinella aquimaris]MBB4077821.1 4-amino-4-deoxychorismate lyase [Neolewinella aquimaris]